ncbi:MAG: glycosyltransferase family 4 protein [Candidatus Acidiferrum sp.]
MRILTFTSLFPTSADPTYGIFIYQRSAQLAQRSGNEVVVVSPVPWVPRWLKLRRWRTTSEMPSQEEIGGLTVHHPRYLLLPKISMPFHALMMFLGSIARVRGLNRSAKIDFIDAHFVYPDGLAALLLGKILGMPVIVSARGTDINLYPSFRLIRPMIRWTLSEADGVIAVSGALKEAMVRLGVNPDKIHVIPNGIDAELFHFMDREEAKRRLNLPPEISLLVSVGALIRPKGHLTLIRAFARIALRHPELKLYILGEGPLRSELEALVRDLKLQDRVCLPGKRPNDELPQWFNAAEVSLLTSAREGWPNVVTESLACGTPVVATRVGGIPEILHSEELGILVEQSVNSVADGLERALLKEWDREAISKQTRARVWSTVAAEVEGVLSKTTPGAAGGEQ